MLVFKRVWGVCWLTVCILSLTMVRKGESYKKKKIFKGFWIYFFFWNFGNIFFRRPKKPSKLIHEVIFFSASFFLFSLSSFPLSHSVWGHQHVQRGISQSRGHWSVEGFVLCRGSDCKACHSHCCCLLPWKYYFILFHFYFFFFNPFFLFSILFKSMNIAKFPRTLGRTIAARKTTVLSRTNSGSLLFLSSLSFSFSNFLFSRPYDIVVHPEYDHRTSTHNLAILLFEEDLYDDSNDLVVPARLSFEDRNPISLTLSLFDFLSDKISSFRSLIHLIFSLSALFSLTLSHQPISSQQSLQSGGAWSGTQVPLVMLTKGENGSATVRRTCTESANSAAKEMRSALETMGILCLDRMDNCMALTGSWNVKSRSILKSSRVCCEEEREGGREKNGEKRRESRFYVEKGVCKTRVGFGSSLFHFLSLGVAQHWSWISTFLV